jgi:para-aminobenzoate synthetase component 1
MTSASPTKPPIPPATLAGVHVRPYTLKIPFIDLAARFAHLPGTVVLLSGGEQDSARHHLLGIDPWMTLRSRKKRMALSLDDRSFELSGSPIDLLREILATVRLPEGDWPGPLAAGLMGYLAYDLKDDIERLPKTSVDDLRLPHMLLTAPSLVVVHDRKTESTRLMVPLRRKPETDADRIVSRFHTAVNAFPVESEAFTIGAQGPCANFTADGYRTAVQRIIDYIGAGDVYQVNLSQRFSVPFQGSAFAYFRRLFTLNPAPFFAFVQAGDHQIVSTSPERFLLQNGSRVETRPIKGTRPRGGTAEKDEAMRRELLESPKDDAELSMIVDLLRNDIGKVCRAGSVKVAHHKRLEAYDNVYHLVSIIEGELDEDRNSADLIRAAFPGGSITGCPKVRAMEIIDELEPCRRHVYCGSIGYISFHDTMDLSIAIRTATITGGSLCFSVGGGIVFDSDPQAEYEETLHKGRTLMAACQNECTLPAPETIVWHNGRLMRAADTRVSIADQGLLYGFGLFETIRVDRGAVPLLDGHVARFDRSWRALMPDDPPDLTWADVIAQVVAANDLSRRCAAVKILATRGSRDRAPWDHALFVTARPYIHRLKTLNTPGIGLGTFPHPRQSPLAGHKTLNYLYYLKAGQWASENGYDEALVLNPDGSVSETHTANLLIVNGTEVIRPASPTVLPGVMAEAACRLLAQWEFRIHETIVWPEMLLQAGQVLAANALMGTVPVIGVDGKFRPEGGDLWRRINDAILPDWNAD